MSKKEHSFLILANSHWGFAGGGGNSQQLAKAKGRKGFDYLFVGPTELRKKEELINRMRPEKTIIICELPRVGLSGRHHTVGAKAV